MKLVTMEGKTEDPRYCEIFFREINQFLRKHSPQMNQRFNPNNIQSDEHGCTKIAIKVVLGEEFLKPHTLGCDYHLDRSVDKSKKYLNSSDFELFCFLVNSLKNNVMEDGYNREKKKLINLIFKQAEFCQRALTDMLDFCDDVKYRWVVAFKSNTYNFSQSTLAEAAEASIKAGEEKNVSLIDAAYCIRHCRVRQIQSKMAKLNEW